MGDIGTFSFFPGKNLEAVGDAGACITNSDKLGADLKILTNHGQKIKYEHEILGSNYRLDSLQAAVLSIKLKHLADWNKKRNSRVLFHTLTRSGLYVVKTYRTDQCLKLRYTFLGIVLPQVGENKVAVWHQYVLRSTHRDNIKSELEKRGISSGLHYPSTVHLQPAYKQLGYSRGDFPVAEQCADEVLSLPVFPEMTTEMVKFVVDNLKEICKELGY